MAAGLGADIQNLIPLKPGADTPFAGLPEPGRETIGPLREKAGELIPQMTHCKRCRADAVGLLSKDRSLEMCGRLQACSKLKAREPEAERPYVAVATREGMLVNLHLGEAASFQIWGESDGGFFLVEERGAPGRGCGPKRWSELAKTLGDCRAVLSEAHGEAPGKVLGEHGVKAHAVTGFIEEALGAVYSSKGLGRLASRGKSLGSGCAGGGGGCG